ncbi:MAG: hypothetical protein QNK05_22890, partial [Myxococcota bacterium]|nr:hypothetical protein [Myxococcota bacterium]
AVWYSYGPDLLILGLTDAEASLDFDRVAQRFEQKDIRRGLRRTDIDTLPALLAHELLPLGVVHGSGLEGPIHTLFHPILSDQAARAFFVGGAGGLPPTAGLDTATLGARYSLLAEYVARNGVSEELHREVAGQLCQTRLDECAAWIASWVYHFPESEGPKQLVRDVGQPYPTALVADLGVLFGAPLPEGKRITPGEALRYTQLFERHYVHSAPFDRAALDAIWQRCLALDSNCQASKQRAEAKLGDLGVSVAGR